MNNFIYETPTKVYFGKDEELKVGKIIAEFHPKKAYLSPLRMRSWSPHHYYQRLHLQYHQIPKRSASHRHQPSLQ